MAESIAEYFSKKYYNPVFPHSFPDPFVLKFRGEYFAYCTDFRADGVFGVLRSRDLVNWREIGAAISPPPFKAPCYWAPEVTYHNGKFYLYYSVGNEARMEIRVAVSDRPDGGFVDSGRKLTTEEFAIDAHVFEDTDGERYLFYATDFLEHTHIGTGTVVDKMVDLFTLAGNPRPVTRAKYDWQVYDPNRREKGGVRWHTVEGAFVLKRKGVYYEMFSGGNWQNPSYGVSFAVTGDIRRNEEWTQFSDGERVFPILRTVPDLIVGPGHNSAVRGVNNREFYCVYHRWTENGRVLAIDRMDFAGGGRMLIRGATHTPQPAPFEPHILDFFDEFSDENWETVSDDWRVEENQIISGSSEKGEIVCRAKAESFLCEMSLCATENETGAFGVCLKNEEADVFRFLLVPDKKQAAAVWTENGKEQTETFALYKDFDFRAFHLLRIEVDNFFVKVLLDENAVRFEKALEDGASQIAFVAEQTTAAFSGFALTAGFEDLFEGEILEKKGWHRVSDGGVFYIENQNLIIAGGNERETIVCRNAPPGDFELAVNVRILEAFGDEFNFGFHPAFDENRKAPLFFVEKTAGGWILNIPSLGAAFPLPENYSPEIFHQFRFLKTAGKLIIQLETETLSIVQAPPPLNKIALTVKNAAAAFDMVRFTVL